MEGIVLGINSSWLRLPSPIPLALWFVLIIVNLHFISENLSFTFLASIRASLQWSEKGTWFLDWMPHGGVGKRSSLDWSLDHWNASQLSPMLTHMPSLDSCDRPVPFDLGNHRPWRMQCKHHHSVQGSGSCAGSNASHHRIGLTCQDCFGGASSVSYVLQETIEVPDNKILVSIRYVSIWM